MQITEWNVLLDFSHDLFLGGSPGGELGRYWQRPAR